MFIFIQKKKVVLKYNNLHHSIRKALEIISEYFEEYITTKQDLLSSDDRYETVKGMYSDTLVGFVGKNIVD